MNIIRVKLPGGTKRFKPFTVSEYRDLLLVRNEMRSNPKERQEILDELLAEMFPEYTPFEREYIFLNVYIGSMGKALVDATFKCPKCGSTHRIRLKLTQEPMKAPELTVNNITFKFKMPEKSEAPDVLFNKTIDNISDGENEYNWSDLVDQHDELIDMISYEEFVELSKSFRSIKVSQKIQCCVEHDLSFDNMLELFEVLLNPDEIFNFYKINRALVKYDYSLDDVMSMMPVERSIVLSLVEKELKEKK
ncbi:baseplate protein [Aeromonas phage L9-6]|nr:baseplate protein [Aeromonas phage L9-6]